MADVHDSSADHKPQATAQRHCDSSRFDFTNWYYWSIWWQHYLYWQQALIWSQQYGDQQGGGQWRTQLPDGQPWLNHGQQQYGGGQQWQQQYGGGQQWQQQAAAPQQQAPGQQQWTLHIRFISGFECYIASLWRRLVAELIDTLLVCLLLKLLVPSTDYRLPEGVLLGADVLLTMGDDELMEIGDTLSAFIVTILLQKMIHITAETLLTYKFNSTPGKWLTGLRVYKCTTIQYTRSLPGRSIKIMPGTNMGLIQCLLRASFKALTSLFCPLFVFFISLDKGRTPYDRVFGSVVVDTSLYRPVLINRAQQPHVVHQ